MVTSIQLGSISNQNGRNVVTGSSSGGLDTEALLESLVEAKRLPAVQLEARIESNNVRSGAFGELQDILTRFRDAADFLRNPPGVNNDADNIFRYRSATILNSGAVSGDNFLSITAEPGASASSYDVTVDQLATQNVKVTNTFALADADTQAVDGGGPLNAGTLVLGPNMVNITLDSGDTLNQVVAKINAVKDTSQVEASIIQVSAGQFRLSFKTTETGAALNYELINTPPAEPAFIAADSVFRLDASDIDGDGNALNNPTIDQTVAAPVDRAGTSAVSSFGAGDPTLDVDGINGLAGFDLSSNDRAYTAADNALLNTTAGVYAQKTFAFSIQTGTDISGTQTIYEQGGASRGFAVHIAPDPGNGNAPTLFAVAHNFVDAAPGEELKVLNLGTVATSTRYNIEVSFDASANPGVNDPAHTFTGYVNGVQIDQVNNLRDQGGHGDDIGIGGVRQSSIDPFGVGLVEGNFFRGQIGDVAIFNRTLTGTERTDLQTYFDDKYVAPAVNAGIFNVGLAVETDAVDSQITVDGTVITRSTNNINDVIDKLTFNLLNEMDPADTLDVRIEEDNELVKSAIFNFVDSYNEFRIFAARQTETGDDGAPTEDAVLSSSSTLRSVLARVNTEIADIVEGVTAGDVDRLADIGITFNDFPGDEETPFVRNILNVDEAALDSALSSKFDEVRRLFEFDFTTDDPDLTVFSRTNSLNATAIALNIDQTNGIYQATFDNGAGPVTVDLDGEALSSGSGVILRGQDGTELQGLVMIFADANDATVNVNLTQGVGDRMFNSLDEMLIEDTGLLTVELETIEDANQRLQEEITRIDEQVERFREQLLAQFSALEQAISQANTLLQSLAAQSDARAAAS